MLQLFITNYVIVSCYAHIDTLYSLSLYIYLYIYQEIPSNCTNPEY